VRLHFIRRVSFSPRASHLDLLGRNRLTWAKATRDLWTEEEVDLYLQDRKRKSCKLDPALNLPSWCTVLADKDQPAAAASADEAK
jgi:hypothetical protein